MSLSSQSLLYSTLFGVKTCPFCSETISHWSVNLKRIHYLWKHPTKYLPLKRKAVQSLDEDSYSCSEEERDTSSTSPVDIKSSPSESISSTSIDLAKRNTISDMQLESKRPKMELEQQPETSKSRPPTGSDPCLFQEFFDKENGSLMIRLVLKTEENSRRLQSTITSLSESDLLDLSKALVGHLWSLATDEFGVVSLEAILSHVPYHHRLSLLQELKANCFQWAIHATTSSFLVKILIGRVVEAKDLEFVLLELLAPQHFLQVAANTYGALVLRTFLRTGARAQIRLLVEALISNAANLATQKEASGLLKWIFESGLDEDKLELLRQLKPSLLALCQDSVGVDLLCHSPPVFLQSTVGLLLQDPSVKEMLLNNVHSKKLVVAVQRGNF